MFHHLQLYNLLSEFSAELVEIFERFVFDAIFNPVILHRCVYTGGTRPLRANRLLIEQHVVST